MSSPPPTVFVGNISSVNRNFAMETADSPFFFLKELGQDLKTDIDLLYTVS